MEGGLSTPREMWENFSIQCSSDITQIYFFYISFFSHHPPHAWVVLFSLPYRFLCRRRCGWQREGAMDVSLVDWVKKNGKGRGGGKINIHPSKTEVVCRCCEYTYTHKPTKKNFFTEENSRKVQYFIWEIKGWLRFYRPFSANQERGWNEGKKCCWLFFLVHFST